MTVPSPELFLVWSKIHSGYYRPMRAVRTIAECWPMTGGGDGPPENAPKFHALCKEVEQATGQHPAALDAAWDGMAQERRDEVLAKMVGGGE